MLSNFPNIFDKHGLSFPVDKPFTVLSIGCGRYPVGLLTIKEKYKNAEVVGIELEKEVIRIAEKHSHCRDIKFVCGDARRAKVYQGIAPDSVKLIFFRHPEVFDESHTNVIEIFQQLLSRFKDAQIFVSCHYELEAAVINYVLKTKSDNRSAARIFKTPGSLTLEQISASLRYDQYSMVFPAASTSVVQSRANKIEAEYNHVMKPYEAIIKIIFDKHTQTTYDQLTTYGLNKLHLKLTEVIPSDKVERYSAELCYFPRNDYYCISSKIFTTLCEQLQNNCTKDKPKKESSGFYLGERNLIKSRIELESECNSSELLYIYMVYFATLLHH